MAITLNDNLIILAPKPIDERFSVANITERNALSFRWAGMITYVSNIGDNTSQWQYLNVQVGDDLFDNSAWEPLGSDAGSSITNAKGIIYGGAEWSGTGLIFNVSEIGYNYYGTTGIIAPVNITLDDGDSQDRFDIIAVNINTEAIVVVKGTPSTDPIFPEIAEEIIPIQAVSVSALATTPTITQTIVYRNNVEWVMSTLGTLTGTIVSDNTDTPFIGSTITRVDSCNRDAIVVYTGASLVQYADFPLLTLRVRVKSSIPSAVQFMLRNRKNGNNAGTAINLKNLGFNPLLTNSWQLIAIPTSMFNTANGNGLSLQIIYGSTGINMSWDLDNIVFSDGEAPPPPSTGIEDTTETTIPQSRIAGQWVPSPGGATGDFIPLSGTTVGNPVTGDIEIYSVQEAEVIGRIGLLDGMTIALIDRDGITYGTSSGNYYRDGNNNNNANSEISSLAFSISGTNPAFKGVSGGIYYGANYTDNTYVQKKYVDDNFIAEPTEGTSGQVLTTDGAGVRSWETVGGGSSFGKIIAIYEIVFQESPALPSKLLIWNDGSTEFTFGLDYTGEMTIDQNGTGKIRGFTQIRQYGLGYENITVSDIDGPDLYLYNKIDSYAIAYLFIFKTP